MRPGRRQSRNLSVPSKNSFQLKTIITDKLIRGGRGRVGWGGGG